MSIMEIIRVILIFAFQIEPFLALTIFNCQYFQITFENSSGNLSFREIILAHNLEIVSFLFNCYCSITNFLSIDCCSIFGYSISLNLMLIMFDFLYTSQTLKSSSKVSKQAHVFTVLLIQRSVPLISLIM